MAALPAIAGVNCYGFFMNPIYNKNTPNASVGSAISLLFVAQSLTVNFNIKYGEATPSFQALEESVFTGYTWDADLKNIVRSGGGLLTDMIFSQSIDIRLVFFEEFNGGIITAYGSLETGAYDWNRDTRMETLKIRNTGPIGTSGGSIFRTWGNPPDVAATTALNLPTTLSNSSAQLQSFATTASGITMVTGAGLALSGKPV